VAQVHDLGIESLISSDLSRARFAGEAIAITMGLSLAIDPHWREMDFGQWDGLAPHEVESDALARFWADPDCCAPPDGERWSDLVGRVWAALDYLASRPTLVVTHAGAMRAALAVLCGFDLRQTWAIDLPYASLLTLRVWPGTKPAEKPTAQIIGLCS
jgi:alpha-ribazole phosphatase